MSESKLSAVKVSEGKLNLGKKGSSQLSRI